MGRRGVPGGRGGLRGRRPARLRAVRPLRPEANPGGWRVWPPLRSQVDSSTYPGRWRRTMPLSASPATRGISPARRPSRGRPRLQGGAGADPAREPGQLRRLAPRHPVRPTAADQGPDLRRRRSGRRRPFCVRSRQPQTGFGSLRTHRRVGDHAGPQVFPGPPTPRSCSTPAAGTPR